MRHATLFLLVALLPTPVQADGPPPASVSAAYARPLHKLTAAEARRLDGQRGLFYVRVENAVGRCTGRVVCECGSPAGVRAGMEMRLGHTAAKSMVVEATLDVFRCPGEQGLSGVTEYWLFGAVGH